MTIEDCILKGDLPGAAVRCVTVLQRFRNSPGDIYTTATWTAARRWYSCWLLVIFVRANRQWRRLGEHAVGDPVKIDAWDKHAIYHQLSPCLCGEIGRVLGIYPALSPEYDRYVVDVPGRSQLKGIYGADELTNLSLHYECPDCLEEESRDEPSEG